MSITYSTYFSPHIKSIELLKLGTRQPQLIKRIKKMRYTALVETCD